MNRRAACTLLFIAVLSNWADGQGPAPGLSAGEQLRLLSRNRRLLDDMVDRGLGLTDANTPLTRVDECRRTADRLALELREAVTRNDGDRLAEISDHMGVVVSKGLVPNLQVAREQITPSSPDFGKLQQIHGEAARSLGDAQGLFPTSGELSKSRRVQDAREKVTTAMKEVGTPDNR